jgi:hypothetical protein
MPEQIMKRLVEEIKVLERELTTELPAEIKRAVAMGDLSENAEYHMAKQRQVFVNARLGQLKKRMGELAMVNLVNIPHDKVGFGAGQEGGRRGHRGDAQRQARARGAQADNDPRCVGRRYCGRGWCGRVSQGPAERWRRADRCESRTRVQ